MSSMAASTQLHKACTVEFVRMVLPLFKQCRNVNIAGTNLVLFHKQHPIKPSRKPSRKPGFLSAPFGHKEGEEAEATGGIVSRYLAPAILYWQCLQLRHGGVATIVCSIIRRKEAFDTRAT